MQTGSESEQPREAQSESPIRLVTIDAVAYVCFPQNQILDLAEGLLERCGSSVLRSEPLAAPSPAIEPSSHDRYPSFSSEPDVGGGDGVTALASDPAANRGAAPPDRRPETRHLWPRTVVQPLSEPRARSLAEDVNAVIKAAGAAGIDIAGIVKQLAAKGVAIASDDEEKSVSNVIYGNLGRRGSVERVPGSGRPILWRAAQSDE